MAEDYKRKIGDAVDEHRDKIDEGLHKAAEAADERTGGKYSEQISSGVDKAKEFLGGLSDSDEQAAEQDQDEDQRQDRSGGKHRRER